MTRLSLSEYAKLVSSPLSRRFKGRSRGTHKPGQMNKVEAAYSLHLEARKQAGEIVWYAFEAITFKIASDCRYTPDFAVCLANHDVELHEVKDTRKGKAHWEGDARVKMRVAAAQMPFVFKAFNPVGGGAWNEEAFE